MTVNRIDFVDGSHAQSAVTAHVFVLYGLLSGGVRKGLWVAGTRRG